MRGGGISFILIIIFGMHIFEIFNYLEMKIVLTEYRVYSKIYFHNENF